MPDGSRVAWRVAAALVLVVDGLGALALGAIVAIALLRWSPSVATDATSLEGVP